MILFGFLLSIVITVMAIITFSGLFVGSAIWLIFGDAIACIGIVWFIIKVIQGIREERRLN